MAEPNTSVIMASVMTVYCPQVPERISVPKAKYTRRMQAKAPALTTATACSSAVTGVGATAALMSQLCMGQMAALTPQPTKASTNTLSSRSILPV